MGSKSTTLDSKSRPDFRYIIEQTKNSAVINPLITALFYLVEALTPPVSGNSTFRFLDEDQMTMFLFGMEMYVLQTDPHV